MNVEEYKRALLKESTYSKYRNKKVKFRGETFDSVKERDYYIYLLGLKKKGAITDLQRQVSIEIQKAFSMPDGSRVRAITYKADFTYKDAFGCLHIVDTKGFRTETYKLKKKLLAYRGIYIEEV